MFAIAHREKTLLYSAIIIWLAVFCSSCTQQLEPPMHIASNNWPGYAPLYLAKELGYFKSGDIHLVELTSSSEVMRLFRNNIIDGIAITLDEALLLKQDNNDIEIVLVMDISHGADVIIARNDIENIKALDGMRIGVEQTAVGAFMLARAMSLANLDKSSIQIVPIEPSEHAAYFLNNKVDAVVTFEPFSSAILQQSGHVIFDSTQIENEIVDVLVFRKEYIAKHPGRVTKLIESWFMALNHSRTNHAQAGGISIPLLKDNSNGYYTSTDDMRFPTYDENIQFLTKSNNKLNKITRSLYQIMQNEKLLQREFNANDIYNVQPLLSLKNTLE